MWLELDIEKRELESEIADLKERIQSLQGQGDDEINILRAEHEAMTKGTVFKIGKVSDDCFRKKRNA